MKHSLGMIRCIPLLLMAGQIQTHDPQFHAGSLRRSGCELSALRKEFVSTLRLRGGAGLQSNTHQDLLPEHPSLTKGGLENGFRYVILQNSVPQGRFHANLVVSTYRKSTWEPRENFLHFAYLERKIWRMAVHN
jgi:hypothetical protein